jgi:hypothetical protein
VWAAGLQVQRWLAPEKTIGRIVYDAVTPVPYQSAAPDSIQFESRFE